MIPKFIKFKSALYCRVAYRLVEPTPTEAYHGTARSFSPGELVLPPSTHQLPISEQGRKKNLDKVFFTPDLGSAWIYAQRAVASYGGEPHVYLVKPLGSVESMVDTPGTRVWLAEAALIKREIQLPQRKHATTWRTATPRTLLFRGAVYQLSSTRQCCA